MFTIFSLDSWQISLLWSLQISLATRDKIQTTPIFYPPVHIHRPASASLSCHRNRLTSRTNSNLCHNRRPLSADSRFVSTKGSSSVKFNLGNVSFFSNICCVANHQHCTDCKTWKKKLWRIIFSHHKVLWSFFISNNLFSDVLYVALLLMMMEDCEV